MERTTHGSLISLTNSGSELRESAVHAIATELKVDYLVKTDINILDVLEDALIYADGDYLIELYLKGFKSKCKTAISDHKL
jgi:hypothetical protein